MSLWWAKREQLDEHQLAIIENVPLYESCLLLGPPGSGKSNVLVRRAQFVRTQDMPNVLVLTFTRSLTEFMRTGCYDSHGREIFPRSCVTTIESWIRQLYHQHGAPLPDDPGDLVQWKRQLAEGAFRFAPGSKLPKYDTLFVDEAQDLYKEEVQLIAKWAPLVFLAGDSRQKMWRDAEGIEAVKGIPSLKTHTLPFHYRVAPEICRVADRILAPEGGHTLQGTAHYEGPRPGQVNVHGPLGEADQIATALGRIRDQIRVYADLLKEGDRIGIIVAHKHRRETLLNALEQDADLSGKAQIIRAKESAEDDYNPAFDPDKQICILTVSACKGLEFRAVHWLFSEELQQYHDNEIYYTVVTRAKTSLDIYHATGLPEVLARAITPSDSVLW